MSENALSVEIRQDRGKGVARRLRAAGKIPAILYGQGNDPVSLTLDPVILLGILDRGDAGINTLIDLQGESPVQGKTVLVKELQREPVRGQLLHADLIEVSADQTVTVSVPIHIRGTAQGVALSGGLIDHALREVELECLPRAIPDELILDVTELELGDSLHVRDIVLPEGVALRTDGDLSVVSVVAPSVQEEEAAEVVEEGAEPEEGAAPAAAAGEQTPDESSDDES